MSLEKVKVTSTIKNENKVVFLQMDHRLAWLFSRTSKTQNQHGEYCDGTRKEHSTVRQQIIQTQQNLRVDLLHFLSDAVTSMCSCDILAVLTILPMMVEQASNITVREGFKSSFN